MFPPTVPELIFLSPLGFDGDFDMSTCQETPQLPPRFDIYVECLYELSCSTILSFSIIKKNTCC